MTITNSKTAGDVVCDLLRRVRKPSICVALLLMFVLCGVESATAQNFRRGDKQMVSGGILQEVEPSEQDTIVLSRADSLNRLKMLAKQARQRADSIARYERRRQRAIEQDRIDADGNIIPPEPWFGDSVSLSRMCWTSALLPGYGQIYNKQYWKLPILYGTLGTSIGFAIHQNSIYKPLKKEYDALILENGLMRTEELNLVQRKMIRSNTTRQLLWGAAVASYIYFLGDAAVNYSTNEVSNVKKATTLSLICPGAGQIYNKSYWRVPIVVGGFATTIYCIDWNNRGYQRFKKAYRLKADYDANPDLRRAVDTMVNGTVETDNGIREVYNKLINWGPSSDQYYVLKDYASYIDAKLRANAEYADRLAFGRKCLMNVASAAKFSSDRTIRQYAEEIWHIEPTKF